MKTWKQNVFLGIVAIIVLASVFTACDDGKPCDCNPKAHLGINETCTCGGKDCNCTEEKDTTTITGITIRRDKTITSAQMTAKISGDISTALNGLTSTEKQTLADRTTEIHIVPGSLTSIDESPIIKIGIDTAADMIEAYFSVVVQ